MEITLQQATRADAECIHRLQLASFRALLDKYQDLDTSPGNESCARILLRMEQPETDYFLIQLGERAVGAIRIVRLEAGTRCRVSPVFILPEVRNRGIAQAVFALIEQRYQPPGGWELETIREEPGNCHLYEKLGYRATGATHRINARMTLVGYAKPSARNRP